MSDYVRIRGLNGICPDVRKWKCPPGPAAFLDAGLPKISGPASLPHGLLTKPATASLWGSRAGSSKGSTRGSGRNKLSSVLSPTWETEGPEGSISQVLSFEETEFKAVDLDSQITESKTRPGEFGDNACSHMVDQALLEPPLRVEQISNILRLFQNTFSTSGQL